MPEFRFHQVDVFSAVALQGNPLAVVRGADDLSDAQMAAFVNWTNLSETTFLLRPLTAQADYRVRIFTPSSELPFAGHPTLGSCHVWLAAGGVPKAAEMIQECGAGLVRIKQEGGRLAFAAPALLRSGPVDAETQARVAAALRIKTTAIRAAEWVDNGPGWLALLLTTRDEVLALRPDFAAMTGLNIGVVAPWENGAADFEVRGFVPELGVPEDPVTGSLNAGLASWLIGAGIAPARYTVSQGTMLGRAGRVYLEQIGETIWVGGDVLECIAGTLTL